MSSWLKRMLPWLSAIATPAIESDDTSIGARIRARNVLYFDVAMARLNAQYGYRQSIDSRSSSYFTIGSTVLPITAGFLATGQSAITDCAIGLGALFLGFGFYLLLAVFYVWSFQYTGWDERPDMEQWQEISTQFTAEDLQRWLGDACVEAYRTNEPILEKTAGKSALALWSLFFEVVCLSVAVLVPIWPLEDQYLRSRRALALLALLGLRYRSLPERRRRLNHVIGLTTRHLRGGFEDVARLHRPRRPVVLGRLRLVLVGSHAGIS